MQRRTNCKKEGKKRLRRNKKEIKNKEQGTKIRNKKKKGNNYYEI